MDMDIETARARLVKRFEDLLQMLEKEVRRGNVGAMVLFLFGMEELCQALDAEIDDFDKQTKQIFKKIKR